MTERDRIDRLEAQVRRMRQLSGGLVLLVIAAVVFGAARAQDPAEPQDLRVKSLRVVDDKGIDRIVLRIDGNDDAGIGFRDAKGELHQAMATRGDGDSTHMVRDRDGVLRYVLTSTAQGIVAWTMLSGKSGHLLQITTNSTTGSALSRYQVGEGDTDAIFIGIDNEGRVLMNDLTKEEAKDAGGTGG